jgi:hypothetical protein
MFGLPLGLVVLSAISYALGLALLISTARHLD